MDQLERELRAEHGLTLADYEILVHLSEAPERRLRMADLADAASVSRSRLTHRVDRMTAQGLVERAPCPTDRRGTFAVLTPAGFSVIEAAAPTHVAGVRRYVVDPLDPAVLDAAGGALGTVAAAIRAAAEEQDQE
ncbi:MarR family transcriptional regulator [Actinomarinicola tropica]|uniref:MarR family transcriptional regulator n=2 Tax=Actinomarinicola tropica TaxID=2789776 RepID=A0A5Q2RSJ5_9ACTN|nr:MarR family transcriptional regulator [Actinomarinicola tropica]